MCSCGQGGQWYLGVHYKVCSQQVEGGSGRSHLDHCVQVWAPQFKNYREHLESLVDSRKDGWRASLWGRLRDLRLFSLEKTERESYVYLQVSNRLETTEWGQVLFSGTQQQDKGQCTQTGT